MERAQNSDSETHVEMLDWTFGSDLSGKALCCIFFGTPCTSVLPLPTEGPLYGTHSLRKRTLRKRILRKAI